MAIIRVASTAIVSRGSNTSYTISHLGGLCDAAFVFIDRVSAVDVSGVTYGGVAMTELGVVTDANNHIHSIWGLQGCPSGTQNFVITAPSSEALRAGAVTYSGVHSTATFPNAANTGLNNSVPPLLVSVTTTVDNCILLGLGGHNGSAGTAVQASTGTTEISAGDYGGSSDGIYESSPLGTGTPGSKSLTVSSGQNTQDLSLVVVAIAPNTVSANNTIKVLVVAGGGSGGAGSGSGGGGGGGGGVVYDEAFVVTPQAYTVTVGNGSEDSVFDTITAIAGGEGANSGNSNGGNGGSGGGGRASGVGGSGSQGFVGGDGHAATASGGGGGGAGEAGSNGSLGGGAGLGGDGGDGVSNSITGTAVIYAGGGGGAANGGGGTGGAGGGGNGGSPTDGTVGAANLGGGGGSDASVRKVGGSGVVIVSYVTSNFGPCTGGTITIDGVNTVHKFTSSGTFTVVPNASRFFNCM